MRNMVESWKETVSRDNPKYKSNRMLYILMLVVAIAAIALIVLCAIQGSKVGFTTAIYAFFTARVFIIIGVVALALVVTLFTLLMIINKSEY